MTVKTEDNTEPNPSSGGGSQRFPSVSVSIPTIGYFVRWGPSLKTQAATVLDGRTEQGAKLKQRASRHSPSTPAGLAAHDRRRAKRLEKVAAICIYAAMGDNVVIRGD